MHCRRPLRRFDAFTALAARSDDGQGQRSFQRYSIDARRPLSVLQRQHDVVRIAVRATYIVNVQYWTSSRLSHIFRSMDTLKNQLRQHGMQVTAQRLATMRAVASHPHATADELTDAVRSVIGAISRQAVYDTLAALVEKDLVRRIQPPGSAARYEDRVRDNHHHLICRACGVVIDVDCSVGTAPCLTASDGHGFSIDEAEVIYWGHCTSCQKPAAASNAGKLAAPAGTAETARRLGPARAPRT